MTSPQPTSASHSGHSLRIGIDARPMAMEQKTGVQYYTMNIVNHLAQIDHTNEYFLFFHSTSWRNNKKAFPCPVQVNFHPVVIKLPDFNTQRFIRYWFRYCLPWQMKRLSLDVMHIPYPFAPISNRSKKITTVHDLALFKLSNIQEQDYAEIIKRSTEEAVSQADRIIAVSGSTRDDIVTTFRVNPEKVVVIHEGVDEHFRPLDDEERKEAVMAKYGLEAPFLLYVGTLEPRKNLVTLLRAYKKVKQAGHFEHRLVLAGKTGWMCDEIFQVVKDLGIDKDVLFPGYIEEDDLPWLYNCAEVFIYPSLYEGFGLPVLEAMACGVPVIASQVSSLPEVVQQAGLLVPPMEEKAFAEAIVRLLEDEMLRQELIAQGLRRAHQLNWTKAARQTLQLYSETVEAGR